MLRVAGGDLERATWDAPADVAGGARADGGFHAAVNGAGDAVVVWVAAGGANEVKAAFRPRLGAWGAPVTLGTARAGPRVALTGAGDVVAAWVSAGGVAAAKRSSTGAWRTSLVPGSRAASAVDLALAESGNAVVAWTRAGGAVEAALRPAGLGDWLPGTVVSSPGASRPAVELDAAQRAAVTWNRRNGQRIVVESADLVGARPRARKARRSSPSPRRRLSRSLLGPSRAMGVAPRGPASVEVRRPGSRERCTGRARLRASRALHGHGDAG